MTTLLAGGLALPVLAQVGDAKVTQFVPDGDLKNAEGDKAQGLDFTLSLSANLAIAQTDNVVGQPNGASFLMGFGVTGGLEYLSGPHELRNTLSVIESFAKTPALDEVTKANDLGRLESLYSYYLASWVGGFGRATFETAFLPTDDIRSTPVTYSIAHADGTTELRPNLSQLRLAGSFSPFTLTQSLGVIAKPLDLEQALVTIRVGGGGRETLASGVLVVKDDAATPVIDVIETDNVIQAGIEGAVGVQGKFPAQRFSYGVDFGLLIPLANNDPAGRGAFDLLRIGVTGNINFSMFEWLGLQYQIRVLSDPQLVEGAQVQNNFFLTFKYDLIPARAKAEEPKVDPVAEAKAAAAAAEERAKAAEEKAKAAEERAKAAEEKAKAQAEPAPAPAPAPAPEAPTPPSNP